jgi:hypothetical protein
MIVSRNDSPPSEMTQPEIEPFNSLAPNYDAWFEEEDGKLIFA